MLPQVAPAMAPAMAIALPWVEIVLGLAVAIGPLVWRRAAALALSGLLVAFTIAVAQAVVRGINIDCGCFGGDSGPVTWLTVARDVALLAIAVTLCRAPRTAAQPAA
ncbi:MAG: hypothetical protein JST92_06690, partial [Deltaproteobacteria bacterium]|nr:hypothetical protein [Deltaproteobacteria bacterium]